MVAGVNAAAARIGSNVIMLFLPVLEDRIPRQISGRYVQLVTIIIHGRFS